MEHKMNREIKDDFPDFWPEQLEHVILIMGNKTVNTNNYEAEKR